MWKQTFVIEVITEHRSWIKQQIECHKDVAINKTNNVKKWITKREHDKFNKKRFCK